MIDHLSPREVAEIEAAVEAGEDWPRVIAAFADGSRLLLGWDRALTEAAIAARADPAPGAALRAACERAARWSAEHGLHLMPFEGAGPGEDPVDERRWFMAVG